MDNGASSYRRFREEADQSGLAEIIREYRDGLILYLNSFVGNIHTAEELAEDTFVLLGTNAAASRNDKYSLICRAGAWLLPIFYLISI